MLLHNYKLHHRDVKNVLLAPWSLKTNAAIIPSSKILYYVKKIQMHNK